MPRILVKDRPRCTGASAAYPDSPRLRELFTWEDRFNEVYAAWRKDRQGRLLLPREACPMGLEDRRVDGAGTCTRSRFKPRDAEQADLVESSAMLLGAGTSHILRAPPGTGKTVLACELIHRVGRTTLVIVPKSDLISGTREQPQWREQLQAVLGLKKDQIGLLRQDTCNVAGKPVVIGMLHSVSKPGRYPSWVYDYFGLVVFDEVHRLAAEQFSNACTLFSARLRLGLSATPTRADGRDKLIRAHCGDVLVVGEGQNMSPKVLRFRTRWNCPGNMTRDGHWNTIPHSGGKDMHVVKIMARNPRRNRLIAHLIQQCWEKGRNVVVFSHLIEHLEDLADMAKGAGVPRKDMGYYVGARNGKKTSKAQLTAASRKKVVLATYGMAKEGTNCPWWDACILATPIGRVEQVLGRVMRKHPDKPTPTVLDLVDDTSPLYDNWAMKRMAHYTSKRVSAEVVEMELPDL